MLLISSREYDVDLSGGEHRLPFRMEVEARQPADDSPLALEIRVRASLQDFRDATPDEIGVRLMDGDRVKRTQRLVLDSPMQPWDLIELAEDVIGFLLDEDMGAAGRPRDWTRCVAQSEAEGEFLADLADPLLVSDRMYGAKFGGQAVNMLLCEENVGFLFADRLVAVRLYRDAMRSRTATGAVRDLWRVLETAFQQTDEALVGVLSQFPDAERMGFDLEELRALLVLRGRASHAQSRVGLEEVQLVETLCEASRLRLAHLVDRVIVTKRTWGTPTALADELAMTQWTSADGALHVQLPKPQD